MTLKASWYTGGYKANIVTYTVALLVHYIRQKCGAELDLERVWKEQSISTPLRNAVLAIAPLVKAKLEEADSKIQNVTEWCKRQACWDRVSRIDLELQETLAPCLINIEELRQRGRDATMTQEIDNEVQILARVVSLGPEWKNVLEFALSNRCLRSDRERSAISRVLNGHVPTEAQAQVLSALLLRVEEAGYKVRSSASS